MKKTITILFVLLVCGVNCLGYDWRPVGNRELKGQMIEYAQKAYPVVQGTKAGGMWKRFLKDVKGQSDEFAWLQQTKDFVESVCRVYPPQVTDPEYADESSLVRQMALRLLDYPLHFVEYSKEDCGDIYGDLGMDLIQEENRQGIPEYEKMAGEYLSDARTRTMTWLRSAKPAPGEISLIKVYNMGYLVRTSERTFAIDLRWDGGDCDLREIADSIDAYFLTHPHSDHFNKRTVAAVADAGKTLILPKDVLPEFTGSNKVVIDCDQPMGYDVCGMQVISFMGNQGPKIPCNVYHISFDGWTIVDNGDNSVASAEQQLLNYPAADIVIAACWNGFQQLLDIELKAGDAATRNLVFLPAHENELGHSVDHRESYREMFTRSDRMANPEFSYPDYSLMGIGESITLVH